MYRCIGSHTFWIIMSVSFLLLSVSGAYADHDDDDDREEFRRAICTASIPDTLSETLTVYGKFCKGPRVLFGLTDGTSAKLDVLASDFMSVTAHLPDIWNSSTTHKVIVKCGRDTGQRCEVDVTFPAPVCGDEVIKAPEECEVGDPNCVDCLCSEGFSDCNDQVNGCETDTSSDLANCGSCGNVCSANHGAPSCVTGECQIACDAGFDDCNNDPVDGCEVNLNSDPANCGSCGFICEFNETCVSGACSSSS